MKKLTVTVASQSSGAFGAFGGETYSTERDVYVDARMKYLDVLTRVSPSDEKAEDEEEERDLGDDEDDADDGSDGPGQFYPDTRRAYLYVTIHFILFCVRH